MASDAAGQGVTFAGQHRNSWDWANSVIFAATIVTTIGSCGGATGAPFVAGKREIVAFFYKMNPLWMRYTFKLIQHNHFLQLCNNK